MTWQLRPPIPPGSCWKWRRPPPRRHPAADQINANVGIEQEVLCHHLSSEAQIPFLPFLRLLAIRKRPVRKTLAHVAGRFAKGPDLGFRAEDDGFTLLFDQHLAPFEATTLGQTNRLAATMLEQFLSCHRYNKVYTVTDAKQEHLIAQWFGAVCRIVISIGERRKEARRGRRSASERNQSPRRACASSQETSGPRSGRLNPGIRVQGETRRGTPSPTAVRPLKALAAS
jgi:hypothetical protein